MWKRMELLSVGGWKREQLQVSPCYKNRIQVVYSLNKESRNCMSAFSGAPHPGRVLGTSVVPA